MSALSLQKVIRDALVASPELVALVPAGNIVDRNGLPDRFPMIILGEAQEIADDLVLTRRHLRVFHTLHVWSREPGTIHTKTTVNAVRKALQGADLVLETGHLVDMTIEFVRYLRDAKDSELSHAVVSIAALVEEETP